mgnify:CR=1 FL=1|tara:strand:+ start:201 stop:437 length:237 start_codon:yes stop_codon:yes gene_type:complete
MRDITKYLKKIDYSLDKLMKNVGIVKNAQKNLETIKKLEDEINKNKGIKVETIELIDQTIAEITSLTEESKKKSKSSG